MYPLHIPMLFTTAIDIWLIFIGINLSLLFIQKKCWIKTIRLLNVPVALMTLIAGYLYSSVTPLSSFFIILTGFGFLMVSLFSVNHCNHYLLHQQKKIQLFQTLFVFSLLIVFIADDVFTFLFAWEMMALTSYFLVAGIKPDKTTRKAGILYLGMAHVGLFFIALAFFILFLTNNISVWHFHLTHITLSQSHANIIFIFILIGFGIKAGLFPTHIWLPEAHPSAPSPISALMSGVMLTTAIYGLILFLFHFLLPFQQIWWGYSFITVGLITMFVGAIQTVVETEIKRLLAYSSMENMGFITVVLGLGIIFYHYQQFILLNLTLLIVLLHCLNHCLFKTLLFLISGSMLQATHEKNLNKLGGLICVMPCISVFALVGALSMGGLPLFNGFISEWLYLSIFFHHASHHFVLAALSPLIIGISVFVFGLSAFVAVKFFGIAFLGQARGAHNKHYSESGYERVALGILAAGCMILGIFPNSIMNFIQIILKNAFPILHNTMQTGLFLQFNTEQHTASAEFNPLIITLSLVLLGIVFYFLLKMVSPSKVRRTIPWSCGFENVNARMQDSAQGFFQPFLQIFLKWFAIQKYFPAVTDKNPRYQSRLTEIIWCKFYLPIRKSMMQISMMTKWFQQGRIATYLLYIGITLFVLLMGTVWL